MVQIRDKRKRYCHYCKVKTQPDYKDVETLKRYVTERGKIVNRSRSGVCTKHQRSLSASIKRARIIATLPFIPKV